MKGRKPIGLLLVLTYAASDARATGWRLKPKTAQQIPDLRITTPDGKEILVGENKTDVLVYKEGSNNWNTDPIIVNVWENQ